MTEANENTNLSGKEVSNISPLRNATDSNGKENSRFAESRRNSVYSQKKYYESYDLC